MYPHTLINSTIFKTQNNELVIFGQTLNKIREKLINFNEIWMQGGRINSTKSQLIPKENLINELSFDEARNQLDEFNKLVVQGGMSLDDYFNEYQKGNTILKNYVTTTNQQEQSTQGLVKASQEACEAQIEQNKAVQQSTLSYKAGKFALEAFKTATNMAVMFAVSKALEFVVTSVSNYIHRVENANEATKEAVSTFESITSEIETLESKLDELDTQSGKLICNDFCQQVN